MELKTSTRVTFTELSVHSPTIDSVTTSLGIQGPFIQGVPLRNTITVRIADWKGFPDRVEFRLPNGTRRTKTATGNTVSIELDMGEDLLYDPNGKWNEVMVIATNSHGQSSAGWPVHFFAYSRPPSISLAAARYAHVNISPNNLWITYRFSDNFPPDVLGGETSLNLEFPLGRGTQWGFSIQPLRSSITIEFSAISYQQSKPAHAKATSDLGTRFGAETPEIGLASLKFSLEPYMRVEYDWSPFSLKRAGLGLKAGFEADIPIPNLASLVESIFQSGVGLSGRIRLNIDGSFSFSEGTGYVTFRPTEGDLSILAKGGVVAKVRGFLFLTSEVSVGVQLYGWFVTRPENSPEWQENKRNFRNIPFIRQLGAGVFAEGSVKIDVVFLKWQKDWELLNMMWYYPDYIVPRLPQLPPPPLGLTNTGAGWAEPDRNYLFGREPYHVMQGFNTLVLQDDRWDVQERMLFRNTYSGAHPSLVWKDGRAVILYMWDNPSLPAHQSTEIRALMQQPDGSWRDIPVTDDTALDSLPSVGVDSSGKLVAVWTRIENVPPQPDPRLRLPKGEIAYSVYNESTGT
ncbi:MAG: hypothetical protein RMK92_05270, partial [Armatimonadota bacterium]|nr:hypothetical protein [Armatimonadota bacterium]